MKRKYSRLILLLFIGLLLSCGNRSVTTENISSTADAWNKVNEILTKISEPIIPEKTYKLSDFGGIGDGITDNKAAFDHIIKECANNGGGKIVVPRGNYLVKGPIHLKSNINLHLQEGSKLSFSSDPKDYLPNVLTSWEGTRLYNYSPSIYTYKQKTLQSPEKGKLMARPLKRGQSGRKIKIMTNCFQAK